MEDCKDNHSGALQILIKTGNYSSFDPYEKKSPKMTMCLVVVSIIDICFSVAKKGATY